MHRNSTTSSAEARNWSVFLNDERIATVVADTWTFIGDLRRYAFYRSGVGGPVAWFREEHVVGIARTSE